MYAESYLKAHGQDCTIIRDPDNVTTKVSLARATKAVRIYGAREAHWQGLVLSGANLQSGEVFQANSMTFLTQSVNIDPATNEVAWFAVLVNATLVHKRLKQDVDPVTYYPIECWESINAEVHSFGEIVTAEMRQRDPGLLEGTKYIFQVPEAAGILLEDRIIYKGNNFRVDSRDDVAMEGVIRIQVSTDTREGEDCTEGE